MSLYDMKLIRVGTFKITLYLKLLFSLIMGTFPKLLCVYVSRRNNFQTVMHEFKTCDICLQIHCVRMLILQKDYFKKEVPSTSYAKLLLLTDPPY